MKKIRKFHFRVVSPGVLAMTASVQNVCVLYCFPKFGTIGKLSPAGYRQNVKNWIPLTRVQDIGVAPMLFLDRCHPHPKNREMFPVAMRYPMDRRLCYNYIAGELTKEDFARVYTLRTEGVRSNVSSLFRQELDYSGTMSFSFRNLFRRKARKYGNV